MFGDWSGLILQVGVTGVVILALIALVYWLVRRYSPGGLGRISRGRVPRLAVVDAVPVDGRRRLVLVRRDNVEHLILVGGPSDLVVEPSIQRVRRPAARPASPAAAVEATPAEPPAEPPAAEVADNPPIPFPQARAQGDLQRQPAAHSPASQPSDRPFFPLRRASAAEPVRVEKVSAAPQFQETWDADPLLSERLNADSATSTDKPAELNSEPNLNGHDQPRLDLGEEAPESGNVTPFLTPAQPAQDTAAKVSDLEREMARLLGEITGKRPA